MTFKGTYFNGKSSTGYTADITLETYAIHIVYSDNLGQTETVIWNSDKIHRTDFAEQDHIHLKYGDFPFQYLQVYDKSMEAALKQAYPLAAFHQSVYNKIFHTGLAGIAGLILFCIGLIALVYFVIIPASAEKIAELLPVSYEEQIGDAAFNNMTRFEKINDSSTVLINNFFSALHYKSDYKIQITVVKSDIVNAYALPGGKIVVYEGILNKIKSSEELVALLSHEFSHVQLRHSTKNICRSLSSYLLISLLIGDAGGITAVVVQNADQLKQLGYSRTLEEEADRNGMLLMEQNKVDIRGMLNLFRALKEEEGETTNLQFLSTHPLTDNRIKSVTTELERKNNIQSQPQPLLDSLWLGIKTNIQVAPTAPTWGGEEDEDNGHK